jgi:hypothetical protein
MQIERHASFTKSHEKIKTLTDPINKPGRFGEQASRHIGLRSL